MPCSKHSSHRLFSVLISGVSAGFHRMRYQDTCILPIFFIVQFNSAKCMPIYKPILRMLAPASILFSAHFLTPMPCLLFSIRTEGKTCYINRHLPRDRMLVSMVFGHLWSLWVILLEPVSPFEFRWDNKSFGWDNNLTVFCLVISDTKDHVVTPQSPSPYRQGWWVKIEEPNGSPLLLLLLRKSLFLTLMLASIYELMSINCLIPL